jgi:hypothetical protein
MALATYRNNETGELLELSEDWLTRFPKDPYTLLDGDELEKLETERGQAVATAVGAQPFDQGEETPEEPAAAPAPAPSGGKGAEEQDTPEPPTDTRDARRF